MTLTPEESHNQADSIAKAFDFVGLQAVLKPDTALLERDGDGWALTVTITTHITDAQAQAIAYGHHIERPRTGDTK